MMMKQNALIATALVLLCACNRFTTSTSPSIVIPEVRPAVALVTEPAPVVEPDPVPPVASHPPTPPAVVAPVLNTTPIGFGDCVFTDDPGSIRCYNKSDISQTLTAAMKDLQPDGVACHVTYGKPHTVTIAPRSNGYFTLPMPPCGEKGQIDVFRGDSEGDCRNAAFTGQRPYDPGACPVSEPIGPQLPEQKCPIQPDPLQRPCSQCHVRK